MFEEQDEELFTKAVSRLNGRKKKVVVTYFSEGAGSYRDFAKRHKLLASGLSGILIDFKNSNPQLFPVKED